MWKVSHDITWLTAKLNECRSSSLLPPINPDIWQQFEFVFRGANEWDTCTSSLKTELYLALNKLQTILFSDQPLLSGKFSMLFCAALIPTLHCVCSALNVSESYLPSQVWYLLLMVHTVNSAVLAFWPARGRWSTSTWPIFHWSAESPWWMLPADYCWFRRWWNLNIITPKPCTWYQRNGVPPAEPKITQSNRSHQQYYPRSTALEEVFTWKLPFDSYPTYNGQQQTSLGVLDLPLAVWLCLRSSPLSKPLFNLFGHQRVSTDHWSIYCNK